MVRLASANRRRAGFAALLASFLPVVVLTGPGHAGNPASTVGVARAAGGDSIAWYLRNANSTGGSHIQLTFGNPNTDFPVVGDWDGNGTDTIGVARNDGAGNIDWYLRNTNSTGGSNVRFSFGDADTDLPVIGDWNGDGKDTIGVARIIGAGKIEWFLRNTNSTGGSNLRFTFGDAATDWPVVGDWNGDRNDSIGVARLSGASQIVWYLRNSNSTGGSNLRFSFGNPNTDWPVVGDWNGDRSDSIGVTRDDGTGRMLWYLRNSNSTGGSHVRLTFGSWYADFAVAGDWNG
jgi:hypothetical protein